MELKFEVAHITGEREGFAHVVGAMGFTVLGAVLDLVENPPADEPYTTLKGRLVLAHQLTPVQKATKYQVPADGGQRQPVPIRGAGFSSGVLPAW